MDLARHAPPHSLASRKRVLVLLAWHSQSVFRGIAWYAHSAGWIIDNSYQRSGTLPSDWRFDGILTVLGVNQDLDRLLAKHPLPMVNIGYHPLATAPRVFADQEAIARAAAHHFRNLGFHHFAYYQRGEALGDFGRRESFRRELAKSGHSLHVIDHEACPKREPFLPWLGKQLKALPKPVALLSEIDDFSMEVIDAAEEANLSIPNEVAVLGVGNDPLLCPLAAVPMSSVDDNAEFIGRQASLVLDQLMAGRPVPRREIPVQPLGVVSRRSTDALVVDHPQVAVALQQIRQRFREPLTAEAFTANVPMSRRRLHDAFLRVIGRSVADEVARLRVEHAKRLLVESDEKQSLVAKACGFGSEARLILVFTRLTGMSPGQYRMLFKPDPSKTTRVGRPPGRSSLQA
jgi:LacI family transcriptional regulator